MESTEHRRRPEKPEHGSFLFILTEWASVSMGLLASSGFFITQILGADVSILRIFGIKFEVLAPFLSIVAGGLLAYSMKWLRAR